MLQRAFPLQDDSFLEKALQWAQQFGSACLFHSNEYADPHSNISCMLAVDAEEEIVANGRDTFVKIENFKSDYPDHWVVGFFGYDLKNEIENLQTSHSNPLGFPDAYFFVPKTVILFRESELLIHSNSAHPENIYSDIVKTENPTKKISSGIHFNKRMSKDAYFDAFYKLKNHIQRGDIYEVNLCQEFYAEDAHISPISTYWALNGISPTPFSTFFKLGDKYILSASPERFLAKRGSTLISQPIKGTAPRGKNEADDLRIKTALSQNPKEIAENIMIVDLVRNDLTRSAKAGTVAAERKLEVHTFRQVHQLISTISCEIDSEITDLEAIKRTFPPGSMTGAPKISAMRLCNQYEFSRRGIYSGAVGYFGPNGDFDFNVIIRTLLYNQTEKYLSFHTGGAITIDADAEKEYQECFIKAKGILTALDAEVKDE